MINHWAEYERLMVEYLWNKENIKDFKGEEPPYPEKVGNVSDHLWKLYCDNHRNNVIYLFHKLLK